MTKNTQSYFLTLTFVLAVVLPCFAESAMFLIDKLKSAEVGDYIVTAIDNTYTVLIIKEKRKEQMSIEEITIPAGLLKKRQNSWQGWRNWIESGAPSHTGWVVYALDLTTGKMKDYFSYTMNSWCDISTVDSFITNLLTLKMTRIPKKDTKRIGPPPPKGGRDLRRHWTPQMIYEGKRISDVAFQAWRTRWPKDTTELSGKIITVYVPKDDKRFPSYFPYWLEIQGMIGKAKVRIIDSGSQLQSTRKIPERMVYRPDANSTPNF